MNFIILVITALVALFALMLTSRSGPAVNGYVDLSQRDFSVEGTQSLDGQWEFYFDRLLFPKDFALEPQPEMSSFIKVPGSWDQKRDEGEAYPSKGVATYRLRVELPKDLKDPALKIMTIHTAYRLYANGQLLAEAGNVSKDLLAFKDGTRPDIVSLPTGEETIELVIQTANLNYDKGGIREPLAVGSFDVLKKQKMQLLTMELVFIGGALFMGCYYLVLFFMQRKNKTALLFSLLCFITATRGMIWGERPLFELLPDASYRFLAYINYSTGYNLIPVIVLLVLSIYPLDYRRKTAAFILLPTLFFDALLFTSTEYMSLYTNGLYLVILMQLCYIIGVLVKAVLRKRDYSVLMFLAMSFYFICINQDVLNFKGIGGINLTYGFLYGNLALIMVMSYVQAKQQAYSYQRLLKYNEDLIEADHLKDKIIETEMAFLQAQIKPHFLYNALSAIANICEKDGRRASQLIVDLAVYLRGSLEFNNLNRVASLEKELEFVETYFHIEQARFGEKIQLSEEIEGSLEQQLPVLILQPLVENAVRHGISKKPGGGTVTVRMLPVPEGISVEIEDDGVGISHAQMGGLLGEERLDAGVGLLNIHSRLLRLYGRGLEITSEEHKGTTVRFLIPEGGHKR